MSKFQARQFASDLFDAWAKAGDDVDAFMAYFTDDVRVELMVREGVMQGVPAHYDKAAWRVQAIAESQVSKLVMDITHVLIAESQVSKLVMDITHVLGDESSLAIEAIGRLDIAGHPYENRYCYVAELRGGKISAFRIYLDTLYAAQAVQWLVDAHQPVPGEIP
jgi:ketosteroid isomerase-like protein